MVMSKKKSRFLAIFTVICLMMVLSTQMVFATNSLNGVGENNTTVTENVTTNQSAPVGDTTTSQPTTNQGQVNNTQTNTQTNQSNMATLPGSTQNPQDIENTANAVAGMFGNAGPKEEDIAMANAFIEPIANIMNKVMAVILGMTSLLMMFTTMLDLLYLAFPPVRDYLDGGRQGMSNMMGAGGRGGMGRGMGGMRGGMGGMRGGYGMGGMGGMNSMGGMGMGGMGGMGMGGMGGGMQQGMGQPVGGGLSAVGRWVSDEAVSACNECMGGAMEGGMGMMQPPGVKSMVLSYIKKRSLFLILFGVCVVLFSSTVFFDLGARLGTWILKIIMGFGI